MRHTCGLQPDGGLACWGDNQYGQSTPPAGTFTDVASSNSYSCAIEPGGDAVCWGYNDYGQATVPADL